MYKITLALSLALTACGGPALDVPLDPPPWPLGADDGYATGDMSKSKATQDKADGIREHNNDTDTADEEPATDEPTPEGEAQPAPEGAAPTTP